MANGDVTDLIGFLIATAVGAVLGVFVYLVILAFFGDLVQSGNIPSPSEGQFAMAWESLMNSVMLGFAAAGAAGADGLYLIMILRRHV